MIIFENFKNDDALTIVERYEGSKQFNADDFDVLGYSLGHGTVVADVPTLNLVYDDSIGSARNIVLLFGDNGSENRTGAVGTLNVLGLVTLRQDVGQLVLSHPTANAQQHITIKGNYIHHDIASINMLIDLMRKQITLSVDGVTVLVRQEFLWNVAETGELTVTGLTLNSFSSTWPSNMSMVVLDTDPEPGKLLNEESLLVEYASLELNDQENYEYSGDGYAEAVNTNDPRGVISNVYTEGEGDNHIIYNTTFGALSEGVDALGHQLYVGAKSVTRRHLFLQDEDMGQMTIGAVPLAPIDFDPTTTTIKLEYKSDIGG